MKSDPIAARSASAIQSADSNQMLSITMLLFGCARRAQKNLPVAGREKAPYRSDKAVGVISSFERFRGTPSPSYPPYVLKSVFRFN
jgi:hypothetical protein